MRKKPKRKAKSSVNYEYLAKLARYEPEKLAQSVNEPTSFTEVQTVALGKEQKPVRVLQGLQQPGLYVYVSDAPADGVIADPAKKNYTVVRHTKQFDVIKAFELNYTQADGNFVQTMKSHANGVLRMNMDDIQYRLQLPMVAAQNAHVMQHGALKNQ